MNIWESDWLGAIITHHRTR